MPQNASDLLFVTSWVSGSVTSSAGSQQLMVENPGRKKCWVMNDTDGICWIRFRDGAASSARGFHNISIPANQLWEMPPPYISASIHASNAGTGSMTWIDIS